VILFFCIKRVSRRINPTAHYLAHTVVCVTVALLHRREVLDVVVSRTARETSLFEDSENSLDYLAFCTEIATTPSEREAVSRVFPKGGFECSRTSPIHIFAVLGARARAADSDHQPSVEFDHSLVVAEIVGSAYQSVVMITPLVVVLVVDDAPEPPGS